MNDELAQALRALPDSELSQMYELAAATPEHANLLPDIEREMDRRRQVGQS